MTLKQELKQKWKTFIMSEENSKYRRTIGDHHYFRTRYSSRFWLNEIDKLTTKL